jgi:hypothetical protein
LSTRRKSFSSKNPFRVLDSDRSEVRYAKNLSGLRAEAEGTAKAGELALDRRR